MICTAQQLAHFQSTVLGQPDLLPGRTRRTVPLPSARGDCRTDCRYENLESSKQLIFWDFLVEPEARKGILVDIEGHGFDPRRAPNSQSHGSGIAKLILSGAICRAVPDARQRDRINMGQSTKGTSFLGLPARRADQWPRMTAAKTASPIDPPAGPARRVHTTRPCDAGR